MLWSRISESSAPPTSVATTAAATPPITLPMVSAAFGTTLSEPVDLAAFGLPLVTSSPLSPLASTHTTTGDLMGVLDLHQVLSYLSGLQALDNCGGTLTEELIEGVHMRLDKFLVFHGDVAARNLSLEQSRIKRYHKTLASRAVYGCFCFLRE